MSNLNPAVSATALDDVFALLRKRGPLCASQISVELLMPLREVWDVLRALEIDGYAEPRPDRDKAVNYAEEEVAWGLTARRPRRR